MDAVGDQHDLVVMDLARLDEIRTRTRKRARKRARKRGGGPTGLTVA